MVGCDLSPHLPHLSSPARSGDADRNGTGLIRHCPGSRRVISPSRGWKHRANEGTLPLMELDTLITLLGAFERENVDYVLVGGVALNLLGIIRVTEDVDFFIRPTPENVDRVKRALRSIWDDPELDAISAQDICGEYPTIRYGPPGEDFVIDLLSRLGEAFRFEDLASEVIEVHGVKARVATPLTLYRMKKDTLRPIDHADAATLKEKFEIEDQ